MLSRKVRLNFPSASPCRHFFDPAAVIDVSPFRCLRFRRVKLLFSISGLFSYPWIFLSTPTKRNDGKRIGDVEPGGLS